MPPIKFRLTLTFEEFQDGRRAATWILGRNDFSNFEFLCHCDASHQVSAQLDLGFRRKWRPYLISERNEFSNCESLCHCDDSHQVSAKTDLGFRRKYRLKNFKMAALAALLDIGTERV